jgi:hypothetical protein
MRTVGPSQSVLVSRSHLVIVDNININKLIHVGYVDHVARKEQQMDTKEQIAALEKCRWMLRDSIRNDLNIAAKTFEDGYTIAVRDVVKDIADTVDNYEVIANMLNDLKESEEDSNKESEDDFWF